jgi:D-alanyl-D-alanine carboxypeptidase
VSDEAAAEFQGVLSEAFGGGGISATVMTAGGTWSGAIGSANGVRELSPDDQLAIGSVTKTVVAAQVMQLVEAGELGFDDPASDHLPPDLDFDTNQATVGELVSMRSGIPDYVDALWASLSTDPQRHWTPAEVLELVGTARSPAGDSFEYSSTNYVLLGLIIEQVRGLPLADVLRDGVLSDDGAERLVFQPDESPTEPMAMPDGATTAALEEGGGYLPSLAGATAAGPAGGMASDSASLAHWWSRLCAGDIVSEASLTEMTMFRDDDFGLGYGLGLFDHTEHHGTPAVGHTGIQVGYSAYAACLVEDGIVVVVLSNQENLDPLIDVADALAVAAR